MQVMAIIPARYGSTRFPGKPLALLGGRPVIQWVYEAVSAVIADVAVACDDERIARTVRSFGGQAVMTSATHTSGTSRVAEACSILGRQCDVVVNVQGDEPFISHRHLEALLACFAEEPATEIATLVIPFDPRRYPDDAYRALSDPNLIKVVADNDGHALYFSRSVIPHVRAAEPALWPGRGPYLTHVGVYAFRADVLDQIVRLGPTPLAEAEKLEQLAWLQHGFSISLKSVDEPTIGIDTPADLAAAHVHLNLKT